MEKLINIVQVSEMLGVTRATIYSWTSQNKIPHIKLSKRLLKFREDEIMAWIAQRSVRAETRSKQGIKKCRNKKTGINVHDEGIKTIVRNVKEKVLI
jgi:excisionase family DNA binding protein